MKADWSGVNSNKGIRKITKHATIVKEYGVADITKGNAMKANKLTTTRLRKTNSSRKIELWRNIFEEIQKSKKNIEIKSKSVGNGHNQKWSS